MPVESTSKRRLAAILFADVVGYTALMQKDESAASVWLKRFQNDITTKVAAGKGVVVNFYGDGALCTFDNPLEAMRCAIDLQSGFKNEPSVPVRIGIHMGTVVTEGDKVYGDSVNIASRIESMGIPGAILVSKRVRDELKNQPDLLMPSLGTFEFKNVEDPMEIFALGNDGFSIPAKDEIKGKLKSKKATGKKWLVPSILAILILGVLGISKYSSTEGIRLNDALSIEPGVTLPSSMKDKRVAVMVFENKTGDEDLEDFGTMISDWITQGLMETGDANVISAANVQNRVQLAGIGGSALANFGKQTGVGVIVLGRYYLQEDQIIIHSNIMNTESGEVIHAFEPIQGPKRTMMELLNDLTQKVLGYWSVRDMNRYISNPPKYEAYQKFIEADRVWGDAEHVESIESLLTEAYFIDSTFFAPILKLIVHFNNRGPSRNAVKRDSIINFIDGKNIKFTKWEKVRYEAIKASIESNWLKTGDLNKELYEMDLTDQNSNYNMGRSYIMANYPQRAVDGFESFDQKFRDFDAEVSWYDPMWMTALYNLSRYNDIIEMADNYPFEKVQNDAASLHLRSLLRLDSFDIIEHQLNEYIDQGVYNGAGVLSGSHVLIWELLEEAYLLNKNKQISDFSTLLEENIELEKETNQYKNLMGIVQFVQGNYSGALNYWSMEEINPERRGQVARHSAKMGVAYAMSGDLQKAEEELVKIKNQIRKDAQNRYIQYQKAKLELALGQKEKALNSLELAAKGGYPFSAWNYQYDIYFKSFLDDPRFQELTRPKG